MMKTEQNRRVWYRIKSIPTNVVICKLLSVCVFCQGAYTFNVGGNIKPYNIILAGLGIWFLVRMKVPGKVSLVLLFGLIILPVFSYIMGFRLLEQKLDLYSHFPATTYTLKYNVIIGPLFTVVFYASSWMGVSFLIHVIRDVSKFNSVLRTFVLTGILVASYTLYGSLFVRYLDFPDIVPSFLDNRNYTPHNHYRVSGFSQEPGDYVYLQSWVLLILLFIPQVLTRLKRTIGIGLVFSSLCLALSTNILALLCSFGFFGIVWGAYRQKLATIAILSLLLIFGLRLSQKNPAVSMLVHKAGNFFTSQNNVIYQHQQRPYHTQVGLSTVRNHPFLGVGPGASLSMMINHDRLKALTTDGPKNGHVEYLLEQGFVAYFLILSVFVYLLFQSIKYRRDQFCRAALVGIPTSFLMILSIYPLYHFYLWFPIAMLAARVRTLNRNRSLVERRVIYTGLDVMDY